MARRSGNARDAVIEIGKAANFNGGLEFSSLTYTVVKKKKLEGKRLNQEVDLLHKITGYAPKCCITAVMGPSGSGKSTFLDGLAGRIASRSLKGRVSLDGMQMSGSLIKRTSAYIMQDDRLFPMLTVYETSMFAADFRLGPIKTSEKKQHVEKLSEQLEPSSARNTFIGDEGTRGVSGGERRRVSIGADTIHGPPLLFLDEPISGLDSTSAHYVIEKVHDIARSGSTVILTTHQLLSRVQLLLAHLIILARGQLMYQGSPKDVAQFARTGMKPPSLTDEEISDLEVDPSPALPSNYRHKREVQGEQGKTGGRLALQTSTNSASKFDHSVRSPYNNSMSWNASYSGVVHQLRFTPSRQRTDRKTPNSMGLTPDYYTNSSEILPGTPTPHSSDYTVNEDDYMTPAPGATNTKTLQLGAKFANSFLWETWILIHRNFKNIWGTPELFLSRLMVLAIMGFMMATMFMNPKRDAQGITNRLSFFIFSVCLFFFSSNDAVPAYIQERFIFVRETSHNAYRASAYTIAGLITYLPFLLLQSTVYAAIVWKALKLGGTFYYLLLVLYVSLPSTNSFVVFVSSVVPNYILGYAAVIAFTALFFLFCGYFFNSHDIPVWWK